MNLITQNYVLLQNSCNNPYKNFYYKINMNKSKFSCEKCSYFTNDKQSYDRHCLSKKHNTDNSEELYKFNCEICNKKYKSTVGIWRHKKLCKKPIENKPIQNNPIENNSSSIKVLETQIKELTDIVKKLVEKDPSTMSITNNNQANFNINIFLNEDCKNAKNLIDFIKEIPINVENLIEIGKKGYIESVSNLLTSHLKRYSLYERPIHYHISAEEEKNTLHVRDENIWKGEKDEVKTVIDKSLYNLDDKLYNCYSKNMINSAVKKEVFDELTQNSGIGKENEQQQLEVINNIIPTVKIP